METVKTTEQMRRENLDAFIHEHLGRFGENNLFRASLDHFRESGKPSGSFRASLHAMLDEYAKEQTSLLKEENEALKERQRYLEEYRDKHEILNRAKLADRESDLERLKEENEKLREALDQAMIVIRHLQTDGEWELWKRVNAKGYLVDHHKPVLAAYEKLESLITQSSKKEEVNK